MQLTMLIAYCKIMDSNIKEYTYGESTCRYSKIPHPQNYLSFRLKEGRSDITESYGHPILINFMITQSTHELTGHEHVIPS